MQDRTCSQRNFAVLEHLEGVISICDTEVSQSISPSSLQLHNLCLVSFDTTDG